MKKSFSNKVNLLLESNRSPSLKILFEDESEKDVFAKNDPLDKPEEDEATEEPADDSSPESSDSEAGDLLNLPADEGDDEESTEGSGTDEDQKDSKGITQSQFDKFVDEFMGMKNTVKKAYSEDGIQPVEDFIANAVSIADSTNENLSYTHRSINDFLFEKAGSSPEEVEADIETLDAILTKGTELVDKFKKGKDIDIKSYVTAAINAYKNFDNLFSKEEIVKQASINVLVLNSGAKAKMHIKEFEELFHEELAKQFGIEYEEHALITNKFDVGSGARSQG